MFSDLIYNIFHDGKRKRFEIHTLRNENEVTVLLDYEQLKID